MTREDLYDVLIKGTGLIQREGKEYKCSACGRHKINDPFHIRHRKNCPVDRSVNTLIEAQPKDFIPSVEKTLPFGIMVPYYAALSEKDLTTSERLVNNLFKAATHEHKVAAAAAISQWSPSVSEDVLAKFTQDNCDMTSNDRVLFRHYIIFKRVSLETLLKLDAELDERNKQEKELSTLFNGLFDLPSEEQVPDDADVLQEGVKTMARMMAPHS
jgi:hypothetical protein